MQIFGENACHPERSEGSGSEPIHFAQGKLRERSVAIGNEILRCAQDDSQALRMTTKRYVLKGR